MLKHVFYTDYFMLGRYMQRSMDVDLIFFFNNFTHVRLSLVEKYRAYEFLYGF